MINRVDLLEKLLLDDDGLLISLRLADGLNQDKAEQIYEVLVELAEEWKGQKAIPKKAVDLFIDIYPGMLSAVIITVKKKQMK